MERPYYGSLRRMSAILELSAKVANPYSITFLVRKLTFEWYVVQCGFKNGYRQEICVKEIGLYAPWSLSFYQVYNTWMIL
jgi:hypothetical protein